VNASNNFHAGFIGSVVMATQDTPASENIGRRYLTDHHSNRANHDPRPLNTVARRLWEKYYACFFLYELL